MIPFWKKGIKILFRTKNFFSFKKIFKYFLRVLIFERQKLLYLYRLLNVFNEIFIDLILENADVIGLKQQKAINNTSGIAGSRVAEEESTACIRKGVNELAISIRDEDINEIRSIGLNAKNHLISGKKSE